MEKIAINIALLLPKEINDFCKELNQNSDLRTGLLTRLRELLHVA